MGVLAVSNLITGAVVLMYRWRSYRTLCFWFTKESSLVAMRKYDFSDQECRFNAFDPYVHLFAVDFVTRCSVFVTKSIRLLCEVESGRIL